MVDLWPGLRECEECFLEGVSQRYIITGQCPSGKNSITITRTGKRFPNQRFVQWRKKALDELDNQKKWGKITSPTNIKLKYYAGDNRRRDLPGIVDAVWHCLEKAGIVSDDRWLGGAEKKCVFDFVGVDKKNPRVEIYIL